MQKRQNILAWVLCDLIGLTFGMEEKDLEPAAPVAWTPALPNPGKGLIWPPRPLPNAVPA